MKYVIELNLPEDALELEQIVRASDMATVLFEMTSNVKRSLLKYQDVSEDFENGVESVFEKFYELLEEHNINIDKLIV